MNYQKIYNNIIEKRKVVIPSGYVEEHHIIPRSLGGTDDKSNLVKLTAKEHFICHLLLTKMYPKDTVEYYKMSHAFTLMLTNSKNQQRYVTSIKYKKIRENFSLRISNLQKGEKNSQYGTYWIYNPKIKESKRHKGEIPDGWCKGRIIDWEKFFNRKSMYVCIECNMEFNSKEDNRKFCSYSCAAKSSHKNGGSLTNGVKRVRKKVMINDVVYDSLRDAGIALGITPEGVAYRIKNGLGGEYI